MIDTLVIALLSFCIIGNGEPLKISIAFRFVLHFAKGKSCSKSSIFFAFESLFFFRGMLERAEYRFGVPYRKISSALARKLRRDEAE